MEIPFEYSEIRKIVSHVTLQEPSFCTASDGVALAYYSFLPQATPTATLLFYHGGAAWNNQLYQYMGKHLSERHSLAVYLFDIRGHGNSAGPRGDTPTKEQIWQDVDTALLFVQSKHPSIPLILGGHSSGCGLVINYNAWTKETKPDAYLFLAPYLGHDAGTSRVISNPWGWINLCEIRAVLSNVPERTIGAREVSGDIYRRRGAPSGSTSLIKPN